MKVVATILAILLALAIAFAYFQSAAPTPPPPPATANGVTPPADTAPVVGEPPAPLPATGTTIEQIPTPSDVPSTPAEIVTPATPTDASTTAQPLGTLSVQAAQEARVATLGSVDPASGFKMEAELSGWGASILSIRLTDYHTGALSEVPYTIQSALPNPDASGYIYPFAARAVTINGQRVELRDRWHLVSPDRYRTTLVRPESDEVTPVFNQAVYATTVIDAAGQPVLTIRRTYTLDPDSYDLRCEQALTNHTAAVLTIAWEQNGQGDMPVDVGGYTGDDRKIVAGYFNLEYDPARQFIYTDKTFILRHEFIDGKRPSGFWPTEELTPRAELAWVGSMNRYFTAVTHPAVPEGGKAVPSLQQLFPNVSVQVAGLSGAAERRGLVLVLNTATFEIPAGSAARNQVSLYAGPRKSEIFAEHPYDVLQFSRLIVYSLGGPCAACTFQPLARGLLGFLRMLHYVLRDWAVAIIILVLVVRLILHPITRRAQINMTKMGKQMQQLQPEMEAIKKKYKDDQTKLNSEMMRLYREKGVNPANMLGCLPMFLQMPIWIALYAMLFYAIELRHQPAFWGFFQWISNGSWHFLSDLSSPDHFIRVFEEPIKLNLIFIHPNFQAINIIPLLMTVVFYFQQKLTMPPPANEQAAQQQKIMKWMTVLFPILLYSAPSGLTLYILASTAAGIVDSTIVRRHIKREEEAGTLFAKKPVKAGGWRERMQKMIEAKQRELTERQKPEPKKRGKK